MGLWERAATDSSLDLSVAFPQSAVSDVGNELEELLQMWHLSFQPSFSGDHGFFLICILILLHEGRTAQVENGHPLGAVGCCQETSFSPSSIVGDMGRCRICRGRFNISQGTTYIGMGNMEVQIALVPPEMILVAIPRII